MKNKFTDKFTLGAISGISALALAVPILAQVSSAASGTVDATTRTMPVPTQEMVQTFIDHDQAFLDNVDAMIAEHKTMTQAHLTALKAAAVLADDTARQAAVQKANDDMRTAMKAAMDAHPEWKGAMPMGPGFGHHGGRRHGPDPAKLAEKLGMTAEELKAAIDSGKTIEEIAIEKGIDLPMPPKDGGWMHRPAEDGDTTSSQSTSL